MRPIASLLPAPGARSTASLQRQVFASAALARSGTAAPARTSRPSRSTAPAPARRAAGRPGSRPARACRGSRDRGSGSPASAESGAMPIGRTLLPLDQPDDRAEADREQAADVEDQQDVADEVGAPTAGWRSSAVIAMRQRISGLYSAGPLPSGSQRRRSRRVSGGTGSPPVKSRDRDRRSPTARPATPGRRRGRSRPPGFVPNPDP